MNVRNSLKLAQENLMRHLHLPNSEARLEAQMLLMLSSGDVSRAWLITHENDTLNNAIQTAFWTLIRHRLTGKPIAYILGCREFYGLMLKVTPDTLIPRSDTETLVETVLEKVSQNQASKILDLGTGTGAIALATAKHRQHAQVIAIDNNQTTLEVAIGNAKNLQITNVSFIQSDWFSALQNQHFDLIASNPPYIEQDDAHLKQGDLRFEPISALASGRDGLDAIRYIIKQAPQHLKPSGWLMLEHGYKQAKSVATLLQNEGFTLVETIKDLGGNDRVTLGQKI